MKKIGQFIVMIILFWLLAGLPLYLICWAFRISNEDYWTIWIIALVGFLLYSGTKEEK